MTQLQGLIGKSPLQAPGAGPAIAERETVAQLRDFIEQGGYTPGARLPPERALMTALGLGRSALRRGLNVLEREGAIWRHVGKGTFVAGSDRDQNGDHTGGHRGGALVEIGRQLTPYRMMRARICMEPALAREAALNASGEAMTRLRLAMERAAAARTWAEYEAQDDLLHRSVAEGADNLLLLTLFDQLNQVRRSVAWGSVNRSSAGPPRDHSSFAEHEAIAAAIEARDPDAAFEAMRTHLRSVSARLFEQD